MKISQYKFRMFSPLVPGSELGMQMSLLTWLLWVVAAAVVGAAVVVAGKKAGCPELKYSIWLMLAMQK